MPFFKGRFAFLNFIDLPNKIFDEICHYNWFIHRYITRVSQKFYHILVTLNNSAALDAFAEAHWTVRYPMAWSTASMTMLLDQPDYLIGAAEYTDWISAEG